MRHFHLTYCDPTSKKNIEIVLSGCPSGYLILKYENPHVVTWSQLIKKLWSAMPWIILCIALILAYHIIVSTIQFWPYLFGSVVDKLFQILSFN